MFRLSSILRKILTWKVKTGINVPDMKLRSRNVSIKSLPLPDKLILPIEQNYYLENKLHVKIGEKVLRGKQLTTGNKLIPPIHAPTSGTIQNITLYQTNPLNVMESNIILIPDKEDKWTTLYPLPDFANHSRKTLIKKIHQSGIIGLSGSGFPTSIKLTKKETSDVQILIINGVECEPYVTADEQLMQEYSSDIVRGILILLHILKPKRVIFSIGEKKIYAISSIKEALKNYPFIELRIIPNKYPYGHARQLIRILIEKKIPTTTHLSDIGIIVLNVSTVYAIKKSIINGEPLTERVITINGESIISPGNFWVRFGTSINYLLNYNNFLKVTKSTMIINGPLSGTILSRLNTPIKKTTTCLVVFPKNNLFLNTNEYRCIRCSKCANVCPVNLLPQQLYWFSLGKEHDKSKKHRLFDCIECGACAYVCPSNIPLVHYYRKQKMEIYLSDYLKRHAEQSKIRYKIKLERKEQENQKSMSYLKSMLQSKEDFIIRNQTNNINSISSMILINNLKQNVISSINRIKANKIKKLKN